MTEGSEPMTRLRVIEDEDGCWKISRHVVDGSPWCNRHHGKARQAVAAVADTAPPNVTIEHKLDALNEQIGDLAEAIRTAILADRPRRGAAK